MKIPQSIRGVNGVVLDTMVLIYLLEDHSVYADCCEQLLRWASEKKLSGVITPITMAELLVKPLEAKREDLADQYQNALKNLPNISFQSYEAHLIFYSKFFTQKPILFNLSRSHISLRPAGYA